VLLPVQLTVEPVSTVRLHVLLPSHVTVLFVPVDSVHWLPPAQVELQFDSHVSLQADWPAHDDVHPVPHVESHVFFDSHEYETSFGRGPLAGAPSPTVAVPKVHVPPVLQVHAAPEQLQSPEHAATDAGVLVPPHATTTAKLEKSARSAPANSGDFENM
jgi:hypothetical protein